MQFQWELGSSILIATAGVSLVIAGMAWRRRQAPGGVTLALLMLAVVDWAVVVALEQAAVGQSAKVLWSKLEYVGTNSVVVLFLVFVLRYTRRDAWLTRPKVALMWAIPVLNIIMAATNEWHSLVWSGFSPSPVGSNLLIIITEHGSFSWSLLRMPTCSR